MIDGHCGLAASNYAPKKGLFDAGKCFFEVLRCIRLLTQYSGVIPSNFFAKFMQPQGALESQNEGIEQMKQRSQMPSIFLFIHRETINIELWY